MRVCGHLSRTFGTEQIGHGQFCATILAKFARRARRITAWTSHLLGIARRREARDAGGGRRLRRKLLLTLSRRHLLWSWPALWWPHHIGRDGRSDGFSIKLGRVVILLNLLALRLDI